MASDSAPSLPSNPKENQGPLLIRVTVSLAVVSSIFVILRLYIRRCVKGCIGWDDYTLIGGTALNITSIVMAAIASTRGAGRHMGDLSKAQISSAILFVWMTPLFMLSAQILVKLSIALTLLRMSVVRKYRILSYITMGFGTTSLLYLLLLHLSSCKDIRSNWDQSIPRQCVDAKVTRISFFVCGSSNIITDIMYSVVIPFPMVWNLHLDRHSKAVAMTIFSFGLLACGASIARMPTFANFGKSMDPFWDFGTVAIWTLVETNVGIIAACISAFKPLFEKAFGIHLLKNISLSQPLRDTTSSGSRSSHGKQQQDFKSASARVQAFGSTDSIDQDHNNIRNVDDVDGGHGIKGYEGELPLVTRKDSSSAENGSRHQSSV